MSGAMGAGKRPAKWLPFAVLALALVAISLLCAYLYLERTPQGPALFPSRWFAGARFTEAEETLAERRTEFDLLHDLLAGKEGSFRFTYREGLVQPFLQDKDGVVFPASLATFTEEEQEAVCGFFRGQDSDRLDMLGIEKHGNGDLLLTLYAQAPYAIGLVKNPSKSPQILYPAFETKTLEDGWQILALD